MKLNKLAIAKKLNGILRIGTDIKIERLTLKPGNQMIRIGGGLNEYRPFFRVDAWNRGVRVTRR